MAGDRVLVTGGAGFIGSHVVEELLRRGFVPLVLDDLSTGKRENLPPGVELVPGDVAEPGAVDSVGEVSGIIHLAAITSVPRSLEDPERTLRVNVFGTLRVLRRARELGVKVVLASSSSVYGDGPGFPRTEDMAPAPMSPYAASKLSAEALVRAWAKSWGIRAVSLRYFNVYGPRQSPDSPYSAVIPKFAKAILSGERPVVYGDGSQTRDFTYVQDVAKATVDALLVGPDQGVFNICSGRETSILELYEVMCDIVGRRPPPRFAPPRPGDVPRSVGSPDRARKILGWEPEVSLREGLRRTVAWMRDALHL